MFSAIAYLIACLFERRKAPNPPKESEPMPWAATAALAAATIATNAKASPAPSRPRAAPPVRTSSAPSTSAQLRSDRIATSTPAGQDDSWLRNAHLTSYQPSWEARQHEPSHRESCAASRSDDGGGYSGGHSSYSSGSCSYSSHDSSSSSSSWD